MSLTFNSNKIKSNKVKQNRFTINNYNAPSEKHEEKGPDWEHFIAGKMHSIEWNGFNLVQINAILTENSLPATHDGTQSSLSRYFKWLLTSKKTNLNGLTKLFSSFKKCAPSNKEIGEIDIGPSTDSEKEEEDIIPNVPRPVLNRRPNVHQSSSRFTLSPARYVSPERSKHHTVSPPRFKKRYKSKRVSKRPRRHGRQYDQYGRDRDHKYKADRTHRRRGRKHKSYGH
eukprot:199462_1